MSETIFKNYDRAALDDQYDSAKKVSAEWLAAMRVQWAQQSETARTTIPCHLDLAYGSSPGERLDIFSANGPTPAPVQIYIHGGYWATNDKKDCSYVALGFAKSGFVTVVINYSLIPTVRMAEQVRQCRAALRWVKENIASYGGDADQIYVTGHSAGGHLALMLLTDPRLVPNQIRGITSLSGVYDLEPMYLSFVNERIGLTATDVADLSPVLQEPRDPNTHLLLTVGDMEGDEYARQMEDLALAWRPNMRHLVTAVVPSTNHFSMRAALVDSESHVSRLIGSNMS